jgi:hypothetical protein
MPRSCLGVKVHKMELIRFIFIVFDAIMNEAIDEEFKNKSEKQEKNSHDFWSSRTYSDTSWHHSPFHSIFILFGQCAEINFGKHSRPSSSSSSSLIVIIIALSILLAVYFFYWLVNSYFTIHTHFVFTLQLNLAH